MPKAKEQLVWKNSRRKVKDLIPYKHNARKLTDNQQEQLTGKKAEKIK